MAITPSGLAYDRIGPDAIVVVDLADLSWSGGRKPSGERALHAAIYAARPDVGAVIHTHQSAASVFAAARIGLPAASGRPAVACAPYALPGSKKLAREAAAALGGASAAILANHGAVAVGVDLDAAFVAAAELETACADFVAALPAAAFADSTVLPARIDAPWRDADLLPLDDGAFLSRAPFTAAWSLEDRRLPPALDDYAQMVGRGNCAFIAGRGARLDYADPGDAAAAALVVEKNCRACLTGSALGGVKSLPRAEAALMRLVYRLAYAKRATR
jgi:hypothetical protein